ncbi:uncharacterized protein LOC131232386 [Magnolia sinica]|uniref:uncharacterized protein LOC131232386 n=1 Tax=Magnolia sinica TaxID=86752 RepID=UPI002657D217|nr:uncharacterized protein LOC131232386 [Magnolia sinica]
MSGAPSNRADRGFHNEDWQPVRHKHSKDAGWSLFVGNLAFTITKDDIWKRFGQFGEILDVYIPTFTVSGRRKGYWFVKFRRKEEATSAKDMLHNKFLARRRIVVRDAIQRHEDFKRKNQSSCNNAHQPTVTTQLGAYQEFRPLHGSNTISSDSNMPDSMCRASQQIQTHLSTPWIQPNKAIMEASDKWLSGMKDVFNDNSRSPIISPPLLPLTYSASCDAVHHNTTKTTTRRNELLAQVAVMDK